MCLFNHLDVKGKASASPGLEPTAEFKHKTLDALLLHDPLAALARGIFSLIWP
jgi:hypothetical protein